MDAKAFAEPRRGESGDPRAADVLGVRVVHRAGDVIAGKYRLERPLGEGGQATVWEAHNLALDARVALKLVHPDTSDRDQAERLLREAQAVARLQHPAVVRVFDVARTNDGDWFIVMELLDGECLAERLVDGQRLASTEALRLLLPVAEALAAAHAAGIVHRDVKPDNIVLSPVGKRLQPKLLDFGIAKLRRNTDWKHTTARGAIVGTPAYLSPEQVAGAGDVDHRSDVWSFAATVYECVTGRLPFEGETEDELFENIVRGEPRSMLAYSAGDAELWRLIEGGLKKSREERWPSMQALGSGLARWLLAHGVTEDARGVSLEATWLGATLPPGRAAVHTTDRRTRRSVPRVTRTTAVGAGVAIALLLGVVAVLTRPAPAAEEHPPQPSIVVTQVHDAPMVVPVNTPPVAPAPRAAAPTATTPAATPPVAPAPRAAAPIATTPPPVTLAHAIGARDVKKPAPRAHAAAASSPAVRASATPDGLRLMNPY